jgi:hypothetical protein
MFSGKAKYPTFFLPIRYRSTSMLARCDRPVEGQCHDILCQFLQQRLGLLEVGGVKAFGEPTVDWRQQCMRFGALALLLPEAAEAHGRPQLQRFRLLAAGDVQGAL